MIGVAVWGHQWRGQTVTCRCDNEASGSHSQVRQEQDGERDAPDAEPVLLYSEMECSAGMHAYPGLDNAAADALSRNNLPSFQSLVPGARKEPARITESLLKALVQGQPDWTMISWTTLFTGSFSLRAYKSVQKRYESFCGRAGLQQLPALEEGLCKFVAKLDLNIEL